MKNISKLILLLSIIFVFTNQVINDDLVTGLTDISAVYTGKLYSGYLSLKNDVKMHYWFFPTSSTSQENAPLLLWLSGGPNCSGMMDVLGGFGPFNVNSEGATQFIANKFAWTKQANVLIFDAPGSGYSTLPSNMEEIKKLTDDIVVDYFHQGLRKFYEGYSEYSTEDLYISGSGYGGNYAVILNKLILDENQNTTQQYVPVLGHLIGNPVIDSSQVPALQEKYPYHFLYFLKHMGVIGWEKIDDFVEACGYSATSEKIDTDGCKSFIKEIKSKVYGLNLRDINADCLLEDLGGNEYNCIDEHYLDEWFGNSDVKSKLNVNTGATWQECNSEIPFTTGVGSYYDYIDLLNAGQASWVYQGNVDGIIPFQGTFDWITKLRMNLGLSDIVSYTSWYSVPDQPEGEDMATEYVQNTGSYWRMDGLSYVSFKACGMDVARCEPKGAYEMLINFINRTEMTTNPQDAI